MINNIFNGKIDIHGGGMDLKFPHHDNEIAQSMCAHDHTIANYWMHNGRIDLSGEKMSKSVGNVVWANDLLDKVDHQVYRFMMLNVPYRQPLNYRDELLDQASVEYEKIRRSFNSLHRKLELSDIEVKDFLVSEVEEIKHRFIEAMSNDFNTANAITEIINISKFANTILREKELDYDKLYATYKLFKEILWVLGIETQIEDLSEEDRKLVKEYEEARKARNFAVSDELRKIITEKGIIL